MPTWGGYGQCPPGLVGPFGLLQVSLLSSNFTNLSDGVNYAHGVFMAFPQHKSDSFQQERLTTRSGVQTIRTFFVLQAQREGRIVDSHCYHYLLCNREGKVVCIFLSSTAQQDSPATHEMIRQTLKLE